MKKIAEILDELKEIGVDWASHPNDARLFDVPKGYFEGLPSQILANIKASQSETELNIAIGKDTLYDVPENYFETLSNDILNKVRARNEIIEGKTPLFTTVSTENPYQLPENYFSSLANNIMGKVDSDTISSQQEIEAISPLLANLKDIPSYQTPKAYFNAFDFSEKVQVKNVEAKVVEHPAVKSIKWARWAAAASIVLIFSLGGMRFLSSDLSSNEDKQLEQALAKIPDARIQAWLSTNIDEIDLSSLKGVANNTGKSKAMSEQALDDMESEMY